MRILSGHRTGKEEGIGYSWTRLYMLWSGTRLDLLLVAATESSCWPVHRHRHHHRDSWWGSDQRFIQKRCAVQLVLHQPGNWLFCLCCH